MLPAIYAALNPIVDAMVPRRCGACHRHGMQLCERCLATFENMPMRSQTLGLEISRVSALGDYDGLLRSAILAIKFHQYKIAATMLGRIAGKKLSLSESILIPVPLHQARLRLRGFNQAQEIALGISEQCGVPVAANGLVRQRNTHAQSALSLADRRNNVNNAFSVGPDFQKLSERTVILVDDVLTTGATLRECAMALVRAGVRDISAVVLAR